MPHELLIVQLHNEFATAVGNSCLFTNKYEREKPVLLVKPELLRSSPNSKIHNKILKQVCKQCPMNF